MSIQSRRLLRLAAIAVVAGALLAGCTITGGSDADQPGSANGGADGRTGGQTGGDGSSSGGNAGVIAPVIADLASIDGTTVEVPLDNVVVLESGDVKVTVWTGSVSDPKVAEFVAGKDDGSATFNPGIQPLAVGETSVSVTDSDNGEVLTFELEVTE